MRARGKKVGLAKLRVFRPFPAREVAELASRVDRIGVLDRSFTFGAAGAAFTEIAAAAHDATLKPILRDYIAGLGGRDLAPSDLDGIVSRLLKADASGIEWYGLKRRRAEVSSWPA